MPASKRLFIFLDNPPDFFLEGTRTAPLLSGDIEPRLSFFGDFYSSSLSFFAPSFFPLPFFVGDGELRLDLVGDY
jgi:hypothetical protein